MSDRDIHIVVETWIREKPEWLMPEKGNADGKTESNTELMKDAPIGQESEDHVDLVKNATKEQVDRVIQELIADVKD